MMLTGQTYALKNVGMGRAGATNADANVIVAHEVLRELPCFLGEGGGEHHVDMVAVILGS